MAETGGGLIESILRMPGEFAGIAAQSPEQAILLAVGTLMFLVAGGVFGLLATGGILSALAQAMPAGRQPPEEQHRR